MVASRVREPVFSINTAADGSSNHGFLATLAALSNAQASSVPPKLGLSVAAHAAHSAFYLEVTLRSTSGDRSPVDWDASFGSGVVSDTEWFELQTRLRFAYQALLELAQQTSDWDQHAAAGMAAALAHAAYHLGAVRQVIKLLERLWVRVDD